MTQLVLENSAFQPSKGLALYGFYVEILLRLEGCSLNRAPVLVGDRFFNAILPLAVRVDFRIDQGFYRKKVSKKVSKRIRNWKAEVC